MTSELPIVVRPARGDDLDGIVDVGCTAWRATYASLYSPELLDLFLKKWWTKDANVPAIRGGRTFVADQGGQVVGMTTFGVHEGRFVVWKVYVRPEAQGHGIGGLLMDAVYERAAEDHDAVWLSFPDGNASAFDFARSQGFDLDHREEQHGLPPLIWMRRALTSPTNGDPE